MSIHVQTDQVLLDLSGQSPVSEDTLEQAASAALKRFSFAQEIALTLVLTDDETIQELNHQFLEIDSPTDVLSFPADEVDPETNELYLGDVILSFPRAQSQAAAAGHPVEAELQLLTVHGVLHLLGHDHSEKEDKARMWAKQEEILSALSCPARPPVD